MDGQPARARERERTSQMPYNFGGLPTNISRASNRRDFIWDFPRGECCRRLVRHKDQKDFCYTYAGPPQTSETLSEESDAQPVADSFAKTEKGFANSVSQPNVGDKTKTQKEISDANSYTRRKPGPKPNRTLSPDEIAGYDGYAPKVRQILDAGLALTKQNLGYTYGSADPANGGMDCSGFIYYLLTENGFKDVPRDSSQQYVWVRKAGDFNAVLSRHEDSFEFDALKPGDLLFWSGTYNIDRDPPVTHTMIYLGREKRTKKRVMIGSSDGRTYDGKQRWGVSVFDFKIPPPPNSGDAKISPVFVGYGRIPDLVEE